MQSVKGRKQAYSYLGTSSIEYFRVGPTSTTVLVVCSAVVVAASPLHASAAGGQAGRLVDAGGG